MVWNSDSNEIVQFFFSDFSWIYKKGRCFSYVHYWCFCWLYVKKVRPKHFLPIYFVCFRFDLVWAASLLYFATAISSDSYCYYYYYYYYLLSFVCSYVIIIMKEGKLLFPCMKCYHGKLTIKILWELTGSASSQLEHLSSAKPRCYFPLAVWNEISGKCFPHTSLGTWESVMWPVAGNVFCCVRHYRPVLPPSHS